MSATLLERVLGAHCGRQRWDRFSRVEATIVSGGQLWDMRGTPQDLTQRHMTVATQHEWASLRPYGKPDQYTDFTPERIAILRGEGEVVSERFQPATHAEGKAVEEAWDALDRAYFNG